MSYTKNAQANWNKINDSVWLKGCAWLFLMGSITALLTVSIINLRPYVVLMGGLPTDWVFNIPLIGLFLKSIAYSFVFIGAFLIWSVVQLSQVLWILIKFSANSQKNALKQSIELRQEIEAVASKSHDPESHQQQIKRVAGIPFLFIRYAGFMALAGYTFDFVVGMVQYPVWQDWTSFEMWSRSFNPMWINAGNALNLGIMMFSFEAALLLSIIAKRWVSSQND